MSEHTIWVEKHRPSSLDNYIGNETLKEKFAHYIETQDIPHLLFYGTAGTGKTTAAKILVKNIDCDYLFINASDERGIDVIRDKIKNFASTTGFAPLKIVVLDECLHEDTPVHVLRKGVPTLVPIKDVDSVNDLVKSWNIKLGKIEWRPFEKMDKGIQEVYEIELENGETVVCTGTHKWYVEDSTGVPIVVKTTELPKYNHILSPEMELKRIKIKSFKKLNNKAKVYDLSVTGNHNFFIGNSSTLTHNCDHLTPDAQAALRNMMEVFSQRTRFILTCNYFERIIPPIVSRCQTSALTPPSKKEVAVHLTSILNQEGVTFETQAIATLVNAYYPDIRRIIGTAQQQTRDGKLVVNVSEVIAGDTKLNILDTLMSNQTGQVKVQEIRQMIADAGIRDYTELYRTLYDKVQDYAPNKIPQTIIHIAEGQFRDSMVVDKEINFIATLYNILM